MEHIRMWSGFPSPNKFQHLAALNPRYPCPGSNSLRIGLQSNMMPPESQSKFVVKTYCNFDSFLREKSNVDLIAMVKRSRVTVPLHFCGTSAVKSVSEVYTAMTSTAQTVSPSGVCPTTTSNRSCLSDNGKLL